MNATTKDLLDAARYDTDKAAHAHYLRNYDEYFGPQRPSRIREIRLSPSHLFIVKA